MGTADTARISRLLRQWAAGDLQARDELVPLVHHELRKRAAGYLRRERPNHTLQPTALVNEAYLRLMGHRRVTFVNRAQFFGVAASGAGSVFPGCRAGARCSHREASHAQPIAAFERTFKRGSRVITRRNVVQGNQSGSRSIEPRSFTGTDMCSCAVQKRSSSFGNSGRSSPAIGI